jgi:murein peptide amidase A
LLAPAALLACTAVGAGAASAAHRQVIGHSVQGRPIVSHRVGSANAAVKVLVIGAVHGDEAAGMRIVRRLKAAVPPARAQLLLVPTINPDGLAAHSRGNAHGVDLNRNFPFRWRPLSGGEYSGPHPLSEPESRAARRLILRARPAVTIWFHQPFGLIDRPNGSPFVARRFSELIGLPLVSLAGPYPGSASRWQNHRFPSATAFVAELPAHVSNSLVKRGTAAVRALAAELASHGVSAAQAR